MTAVESIGLHTRERGGEGDIRFRRHSDQRFVNTRYLLREERLRGGQTVMEGGKKDSRYSMLSLLEDY